MVCRRQDLSSDNHPLVRWPTTIRIRSSRERWQQQQCCNTSYTTTTTGFFHQPLFRSIHIIILSFGRERIIIKQIVKKNFLKNSSTKTSKKRAQGRKKRRALLSIPQPVPATIPRRWSAQLEPARLALARNLKRWTPPQRGRRRIRPTGLPGRAPSRPPPAGRGGRGLARSHRRHCGSRVVG